MVAIIALMGFSVTAQAQTNAQGFYAAQTSDLQKIQDEKEKQDQQRQAGTAGADQPGGFVDEYNSKYNGSSKPSMPNNMPGVGLLPQSDYSIYFTKDAKPNEATLHVSSNASVSGCVKMSPMSVVSQEIGPTITFKISDPSIGVDRKVRYSQFACPMGVHFATADITLDRDYLISHHIQKIGLQAASLTTDYYDLDVANDHIALIAEKAPQAFRPFNDGKQADPLAYAFAQTK